jgi:hypothetical protein
MVFVDGFHTPIHAPFGGRNEWSGTVTLRIEDAQRSRFASDDLYFPAYSVSIWQERLAFCISMIFFEVLYDYFYYCLLFRLVQKDRKMFVDELVDRFLCVIFLFGQSFLGRVPPWVQRRVSHFSLGKREHKSNRYAEMSGIFRNE